MKIKDKMRRGSILIINYGLNKKWVYFDKIVMIIFCVIVNVLDN